MLLTVLLLLCCGYNTEKKPVVLACYGLLVSGLRTGGCASPGPVRAYLRLTRKLAIGSSDTEYHWFWFWRNCFHGS